MLRVSAADKTDCGINALLFLNDTSCLCALLAFLIHSHWSMASIKICTVTLSVVLKSQLVLELFSFKPIFLMKT